MLCLHGSVFMTSHIKYEEKLMTLYKYVCMGGVFVTSHIEYEEKFLKLYKYGLLIILLMHFKVVRVHLGSKWIISTQLGVGHYI